MKVDKMAGVFINLANFAQHTLLGLAPPSGYTLHQKVLITLAQILTSTTIDFKREKKTLGTTNIFSWLYPEFRRHQ